MFFEVPKKVGIVSISTLSLECVDDIFEYSSNPLFFKYLSSSVHISKNDTMKYISFLLDRSKENNIYWAIKLSQTGKTIGTVGLLNIDEINKSVELAFGIGVNFWGKGYTSSLIDIMCDYVFNQIKFSKIVGGTNIRNRPVINALIAMGFEEDYSKTNTTHWYYFMDRNTYQTISNNSTIKSNIGIHVEDIVKIISETIDDDNININTNIEECINWDSLNHINIIEGIVSKYNVKFSPSDVVNATSVNSIYQIIKAKLE